MTDVLLVGATGQVGRYILRELLDRNMSVKVLMRRASKLSAWMELQQLTGRADDVEIVLGDAKSALPNTYHIINSAGHTGLDGAPARYWSDNVDLAMRLAWHARYNGTLYHHISTESVAVMRTSPLTEAMDSLPHPRQTSYSLSKVIGEKVVESILPSTQLTVYRICDVVPDGSRMDEDWRRDHWLSVMFSAGQFGFGHVPDGHDFFINTGSRLASQLVGLAMSARGGRYHVLGHNYSYGYLRKYAIDSAMPPHIADRLSRRLGDILVRGEPMSKCIVDGYTRSVLDKLKLSDTITLGSAYWSAFSQTATHRLLARRA